MARTFTEVLHKGYAQSFDVIEPALVDERSEFQHVRLFDTVALGRVLVLDNIVQLSTRDEGAYSEILAHLPYFEILCGGHKPSRALIIGGGDGAVAEEFLKHPALAVDMAEIDPKVIEVSKAYLAEAHKGAFDNPRLNVLVRDGAAYLREPGNQSAFDIIVADRPDPVGPAEVLFADEFYKSTAEALTDQGVAIFQTGVPHFQADELKDTLLQLQKFFRHTGVVLSVVPTYVGGFMGLTWGSNGTVLGTAAPWAIEAAYQLSGIKTDYYNPEMHRAALALPNWVKRLLD